MLALYLAGRRDGRWCRRSGGRACAAAQPAPAASKNPDVKLHLNDELRAAAQLILQDVIDDFAPHIETEIKRRLDARMERLLSQYE
ncbi:DNA polymerase III subunit chi [Pseudomonas fluorescens HK44]|uniref:DNA polymerase III subunit chi n=1 Tax=Pseudomonas fluorescens HK44 TaxID=1042209 RepID=A0A010S289_PSEFL|nr:DNA polymerase III subunit chi [Pseudomonas fluorescens HK44]